MDFNIVTFHTANNYGAVLQAYALQEFIANMGYSAGIYNYIPPKPGSSSLKVKVSSALGSIYKKKRVEKNKKFETFRKEYLNLNLEENSKVFVSGSDQVWNPKSTMNPNYYLHFVGDSSLRASYAASLGVSSIPENRTSLLKERLSRFDAVSVREEDAKNLLTPLYSGEISVNVDPTLLCSAEEWQKLATPIKGLPNEYVLVYLLHIPKNANALLKWLKKELGCEIVLIDGGGFSSLVTTNDICLRNVGPNEFLWLFANAKSVVTSSFHGTAFSIIFKKEFYSIVNPAMPSRISNLLNMCGINSVSETDEKFVRNIIDWNKVEQVLALEKNKSEEYIKGLYSRAQGKFRKPVVGTVEDLKDKCTGCTACEAICPVNAITITLNKDGFLSPEINSEKCINCSLCKKECPLNSQIGNLPKKAWYGWHTDKQVRDTSTSGGAFRALADVVLENNGVVYGAVYSEDLRSVVISSTDEHNILDIQKSKYTVSNPTGVFKKIKSQLDSGRVVLFCSTPCQVAGLTAFLKKDYDNLIKCDFVCGGMSSLNCYREHLDTLEKQYGSKIKSIDFRSKIIKWQKMRMMIEFENGKKVYFKTYKDSYYSAFVNHHISVRKSCLSCKYHDRHVSDITIADFWGYKLADVKPNNEGMSLIVANTQKGSAFVDKIKSFNKMPLSVDIAKYAFACRTANAKKLEQQDKFFAKVKKLGFEEAAKPYLSNELKHIKSYIKVKLKLK